MEQGKVSEIETGQTLELEHLLSFTGWVSKREFRAVEREMDAVIRYNVAKRAGYPIMVTFHADEWGTQMELLIPINKKITKIGKFTYKDHIKIVNAVKVTYEGDPTNLHQAHAKLNRYIIQNRLMPTTTQYNVPRKIDVVDFDTCVIDVYVGISPNIL